MGSLWGTYDEAANASSFKDAVGSWRNADAPSTSDTTASSPSHSTAVPLPTPAPKVAKQACFECMRRFQSEAMICQVTQRTFCSPACFSTYQKSQARSSKTGSKRSATALEQLRARLAQGASEKNVRGRGAARGRVTFAPTSSVEQLPQATAAQPAGGSSLWGTYDEAANAASFKQAVADFRSDTNDAARPEPEPEPEPDRQVTFSPVNKSACYKCFKLFPTDSGVRSAGRIFCTDACAPDGAADLAPVAMAPVVTAAPAVGPAWVVRKGSRAQYTGAAAQYAGVVGTVTRDPDRQGETKLRLDDGTATGWLQAVSVGRRLSVHSFVLIVPLYFLFLSLFGTAQADLVPVCGVPSAAPAANTLGERQCERDGCTQTFVSWRGVAVLGPSGAQMFCSDSCVTAA